MSLEREVSDIGFSFILKLRVAPTQEDSEDHLKKRLNLVATSKYGLIFVACKNGLRTLETSSVISKSLELNKAAMSTLVEDFVFIHSLELCSTPVHISLNSSQTILAVILKKNNFYFALLYDTHSFAKDSSRTPEPFTEAKLTSEMTEELMDFAWNPGLELPNHFAFCFSSGCCKIMEVTTNNDINIIGTLNKDEPCSCLCWSPKGKQLVIGKTDGSLAQYDTVFSLKKHIKKPPLFSTPVKVIDVLWVSTYCFFAAFEVSVDSNDNEMSIILIHAAKNQECKYIDYKEVCFGYCHERLEKYFFKTLPLWNGLIVTMSANSTEVALLGKGREEQTWEKWSTDDNFRAETPLSTTTSEDTYPLGFDIDFTNTGSFLLEKGSEHPPVPIITILTTDWVLIAYRLFYKNQPSIVCNAELLDASKARKIKSSNIAPSVNIKPILPKASVASSTAFTGTTKSEPLKIVGDIKCRIPQKQDVPIPTAPESSFAPPRSPAVARTLKFGDPQSDIIPCHVVSIKKGPKPKDSNTAVHSKYKKFQCELSDCDRKIQKIYDDVMNSPITVVSSERMTNLLTNIDITNGFIADFKDKIKKQKQLLEDFDLDYQQNFTSYKHIAWKVENHQSPKTVEQISLRPLEPILKRKWIDMQSKELDIRQKLETLQNIALAKECSENKSRTIHSELIISTLLNHKKTIAVFKDQLNSLTKNLECIMLEGGIKKDVDIEDAKREKHKLIKKSLISRKIKKIECLSQSTFTLPETLKSNKFRETEVPNAANNSALDNSRDTHIGAPVAHSTPFVKADDGKKGKVFGSSTTFIKPQPTLAQNLPRPNLSTFRVTAKENVNSEQNEAKTFDVGLAKSSTKNQDIAKEPNITTQAQARDSKSILNVAPEECQKNVHNQKLQKSEATFKQSNVQNIVPPDEMKKNEKKDAEKSNNLEFPVKFLAHTQKSNSPEKTSNANKTTTSQLVFSTTSTPSTHQVQGKSEISSGVIKPTTPGSCFSLQSLISTTSVTSSNSIVSTSISSPASSFLTTTAAKLETKTTVSFRFPESLKSESASKSDAINSQAMTNVSSTEQKSVFSLPKSDLFKSSAANVAIESVAATETMKPPLTFGTSTFASKPIFSTVVTSHVTSSTPSSNLFSNQSLSTSSPFNQQPSSQPENKNIFGSGGFMSGLGKANQPIENKNVFGGASFSSPNTQSNLFGSKVGSTTSFSGNSGQFSSGSTNVAKSGFGDFQSNPNTGGFGSAPSFGSPPAFGGQPSFGSTTNFGGTSTFGASAPKSDAPIFGSSSSSAGFGSLASSNTPSFGNLAQQGSNFDSSKPTGVSFTAYRS